MTQLQTAEAPSIINDMAKRFGMDKRAFEATLKATVVPANTSNEQFAAFLLVAKQYNLNPITKEIYAFPAKGGGIQPIVGIDGWCNIINSNPQLDGIEFEDVMTDGKLTAITCRIYRKDRSKPTEATEYMEECKKDSSEPWKKWPARMLRHKALIQCARYAFSLSGIVDPDEAERMIDVTPTVTNPVTGEVMPRLPSQFKNAAARKTFCTNAIDAVGKEKTLEGLLDTFKLYEPQVMQMELSDNDHDVLGADEIRKQFQIAKNRLLIATRETPEADYEELPPHMTEGFPEEFNEISKRA